jgi:hypothetical protein
MEKNLMPGWFSRLFRDRASYERTSRFPDQKPRLEDFSARQDVAASTSSAPVIENSAAGPVIENSAAGPVRPCRNRRAKSADLESY